jgi:hypothetical protein
MATNTTNQQTQRPQETLSQRTDWNDISYIRGQVDMLVNDARNLQNTISHFQPAGGVQQQQAIGGNVQSTATRRPMSAAQRQKLSQAAKARQAQASAKKG